MKPIVCEEMERNIQELTGEKLTADC